MRIMVVGASGNIGSAVVAELAQRHDVVAAGRSSGDVRLDMADADSIRSAYAEAGPLDAVVCCAGKVNFAPLAEMDADAYAVGLGNKLMGQVNLVLLGRDHVADGGSFTLTTGVLDRRPILTGSSASMVNGAVNGFVMSAAIDMPRDQRINVLSPGLLVESVPAIGHLFPGFDPVPAARVAKAYAEAVEGSMTGQVIHVDAED